MKFILDTILFLGCLYVIVCIILFFLQEKILFYPEKLPSNHTYHFSTSFEEIDFHPDSGTTINALLFKHPRPKGVILYFHGNAGSLQSWGAEGEYLSRFKYDVLMVDYREYGKSRGAVSEENLYKDAQYVYDYLKKNYAEEDIIVFGRSLGTGIATFVASRNSPGKLILETPYYSMRAVAQDRFPWLPIRLLLRYPLLTYAFIEKVRCPICIFHGTQDEVIPYQFGWQLKKLLKKEDQFITVKGGHHNDLGQFYEYEKALTLFLL
ncbi:alpha/beta hydrolase [Xanthocytophaga agilis]|uniref:Alpha/beta hydrolase n=1 Tax=Xanthocytophaga agilis TaxID=3048010 RepID=A0AAE3R373_9BACT|nr:alpha/beta hydrolase [Xanthocytophaga agilis]MDJ1502904.1 alpha/beta hydrolase [Xanthocytophaga agilis]